MQHLNKQIVNQVRAGFVQQGTSLDAYCKNNGIDSGNIHRYLRGEIKSDTAKQQRAQVIAAAKIKQSN